MNSNSFRRIPGKIREQVNIEFQQWILDHIAANKSFAFETTLRSSITFDQSLQAHERGFWTSMDYVAAGSVEESIRRIMERSYRGGHSASERLVREIYSKSTQHLLMALDFAKSGIEVVRIYDNSELGGHVRQLLSFHKGEPRAIANKIPEWLELLLAGSKFDVVTLRKTLARTLRSN